MISDILDVNQTMQTNTAVHSFVFQGRATLIIQQMFTLIMKTLFFCTFVYCSLVYFHIIWILHRDIKNIFYKKSNYRKLPQCCCDDYYTPFSDIRNKEGSLHRDSTNHPHTHHCPRYHHHHYHHSSHHLWHHYHYHHNRQPRLGNERRSICCGVVI